MLTSHFLLSILYYYSKINNATITHECHDNFIRKKPSAEGYTLADGFKKINTLEKVLNITQKKHTRKLLTYPNMLLMWQITVIRIPNRNEDFAVNPLWCRGGYFPFRGCIYRLGGAFSAYTVPMSLAPGFFFIKKI